MSSSRSTYAASTTLAGCPPSMPSTPPTPRRAAAHCPLDSTPDGCFRRPFRNSAVEAGAKCKPFGMLGAVSGTRTATARPADRGGRGARERILTAATTLFHREGIHATGVERLTEHAHVSKRTFYDHFSSKNDLVEEYLRRIHHAGGMPSEQAIDTADASPRGRLLAIFDSAPGSRFRGCPLPHTPVQAGGEKPRGGDNPHAAQPG